MTLERNLSDLRRHADDFTRSAGCTFTVLDPGDNDVIGCVYLYPSASEQWDVTVQSWVRADRSCEPLRSLSRTALLPPSMRPSGPFMVLASRR